MHTLISIIAAVALLTEGYLFKQREKELLDKIAELQDSPTEAQCVHAIEVCVSKYLGRGD